MTNDGLRKIQLELAPPVPEKDISKKSKLKTILSNRENSTLIQWYTPKGKFELVFNCSINKVASKLIMKFVCHFFLEAPPEYE